MSRKESVGERLESVRSRLGSELARPALLAGAVGTVVVLAVIPLVFLLWTSVWSGFPGELSGAFTVDNYIAVYLQGAFDVVGLFSNSVFVAVGMTAIAMGFGLTLAWLLVRTNLPTKGAIELVIISPYAVPTYIYAIMYIVTYGPENGIVPTYLSEFAGLGFPLDLFSPWGITVVLGLNAVTTFYLLTVPAFQKMDARLEEVARIHGASTVQTLRTVTLPLITPAILSAVIVTLILGLGEFGVVAILGARGGFDVYATAIWAAVNLRFPPQYGHAAALSMSLVLVTVALVWLYRTVTARKEDYMTVSSRGHQPSTVDLGRWRWPLAGCLWTVMFVVWILPVVVMALVSVHSVWFGLPEFSNLSLTHYAEIIADERLRNAFTNSLIISVTGATLGTILVVLTAYYTERTEYPFSGLVEFLTLSPLAVPGIILGAGLLFTSLWVGKLHPIVDLYGTLWLIMIGCVIVFVPVTSRIAVGNVVQIHAELEEVAQIGGASWLQSMREVFLPLFRNTTAIIWFYFLVHIVQLLTIPIMTYTPGNEILAVEIFTLWSEYAAIELVSAISMIFIGMTLCVLLVFRLLGITFYELNYAR